jgi:hypothetical protein
MVALAAEQPSPQSLRQLEHEYSLVADLDPAWAARPLEITRREGRTMLVLKDPGGDPLDRVLARTHGQPLELTRSLRIAIGFPQPCSSCGSRATHGPIFRVGSGDRIGCSDNELRTPGVVMTRCSGVPSAHGDADLSAVRTDFRQGQAGLQRRRRADSAREGGPWQVVRWRRHASKTWRSFQRWHEHQSARRRRG